MTFQLSYAKLLADPEFGHLKKRRDHAKLMYLEGMRRALDIARNCEDKNDTSLNIELDIEVAIEGESR